LSNKQLVKVLALDHYDKEFALPTYETIGAAGADVKASLPASLRETGFEIKPGERVLIPTGLCFEIPLGFEVQVRPRSGISLKTSLLVVNSPGTIDHDYRGEVKIIVGNFGKETHIVEHGTRIAQLIIAPITQCKFQFSDSLSDTERGEGGFGSTGTK